MSETISIKDLGIELRSEFPSVPSCEFIRLLETYRHDYSVLVDRMAEAEDRAVREREDQRLRIEEVLTRIRVNDQHIKLHLTLPSGIDMEHSQMLLTYGFIVPGRRGLVYTCGNVISGINLHINVQNKMGARFRQDKYDQALAYFVAQGVVQTTGRKSSMAYSLCTDAHNKSVTEVGRVNVGEVKKFLHEKMQ